jgi:GDP-D-mannose dehydratase
MHMISDNDGNENDDNYITASAFLFFICSFIHMCIHCLGNNILLKNYQRHTDTKKAKHTPIPITFDSTYFQMMLYAD